MQKTEWSEVEDNLILKLRKSNTPYKEIVSFFPNRTQDSIRNRFYVLTKQLNNAWLKDEKIAVLDIECSQLDAYRGFLISYAFAYEDGTVKSNVLTKKEITKGIFDKRLMGDLIKDLGELDTVIGYYSKRYDLPFVRTRALYWNLDFPAVGTIKHIDLYDTVKHKLKLPRSTLEMATKFIGVNEKNHVEMDVWLKAAYGNTESLAYIVDHNERDVRITLELYKKLLPLVKFTKGIL